MLFNILITDITKTDGQFCICSVLLGMHKTTAVHGDLLMSLLLKPCS